MDLKQLGWNPLGNLLPLSKQVVTFYDVGKQQRKKATAIVFFKATSVQRTSKSLHKKSIPTLFLPGWMCDIQLPGWMCATNYSIFEQLHDNQQNEVMFMKAKKVGTIIKASAI